MEHLPEIGIGGFFGLFIVREFVNFWKAKQRLANQPCDSSCGVFGVIDRLSKIQEKQTEILNKLCLRTHDIRRDIEELSKRIP